LSDQNQKTIINMPKDAALEVADTLAHQLGSDAGVLEEGLTDIRRLSSIYPDAVLPLIYCSIRGGKSRAFRKVLNQYLNMVVSVEARGRRDIIKMEMASKGGGSVNVSEDVNKPGWLDRNLFHRTWEEDEKKRLGV